MTMVNRSATVLALPTPLPASITANGNSGDITVGTFTELAFDLTVGAPTGTTPTLDIYVDRKGGDSVYYQIFHGTQLTGAGTVSTSLGVGAATNQAFGSIVRVRWVIGGTASPTFPGASCSLIGK